MGSRKGAARGQVRATGPIDDLLCKADQTQITAGRLSDTTVEEMRRVIAEREFVGRIGSSPSGLGA